MQNIMLKLFGEAIAGFGFAIDTIQKLLDQGPLIAVFVLICGYLIYQIHKKDKEIKNLNEYIRESDKENLKTLSDVSKTLDKVLENQKNTDNVIISEISNLKEVIKLIMDNKQIKNNNDNENQ